jgi:hypothetical protein
VALLAPVAGPDMEPTGGSDGTDGWWRIADKFAEDRVISAADPDARHTRKSGHARREGYRAHVERVIAQAATWRALGRPGGSCLYRDDGAVRHG